MGPSAKLTADVFEERYGDLVAREHGECTTPYTLRKALTERKEPIHVTDGILKVWFAKHRVPDGAVKVSSAEELQEKYGSFPEEFAKEKPSMYKLMRALRERQPPIVASDSILKKWFKNYTNDDILKKRSKKYNKAKPTHKRPLSVLKRPAAAVSRTRFASPAQVEAAKKRIEESRARSNWKLHDITADRQW